MYTILISGRLIISIFNLYEQQDSTLQTTPCGATHVASASGDAYVEHGIHQMIKAPEECYFNKSELQII